MVVFAIIMILALAIANLLQLPWLVGIIWEQIKTGWGYGTNMELAVLYPWMFQLLCLPVVFAAIIYIVLSLIKKEKSHADIIAKVMTAVLMAQYVLINVFIFN